MEIIPDNLHWKDSYKLYTGSIMPRPIALVSTISKEGIPNLAPFSSFSGVSPHPFIISFAPMFRPEDGTKKDTLQNIEATRQFVVNTVTEDIVLQMNETSAEFSSEIDEFQVSGLTPIPSSKVMPYRVKQSPIQMECELVDIVSFGQNVGSSSLVLGRVVQMHVDDSIYKDGKIDFAKMKPVGRLAGEYYTKISDLFTLKHPKILE
ncbi:flavin reductase family protein [Shimazuella sp. AN120528]|uniref:flavin reductase family protein n=1 Tax=Shimazuella soli TaxID=1892854 RepID=UPI001F0E12BA|nr:flavin reductase family protein [Shimazuella soli]MCH5586148.1 flavin reductase family protein [Shimazuella soli]